MEEWQQAIIETKSTVAYIKAKVEGIEKSIAWQFRDHEGRIRSLEHNGAIHNGEVIAEEKFYQRHRGKIGIGIGGVSIATVLALIGGVLKILGVI